MLGAVFEAPAFISGFDNVAMMGEPVEERGRHLGVAEDARPFTEGQIGRDDHRCAFVELANEMEEQLPTSLSEGQIAEFVENGEVLASEVIGNSSLSPCACFGLQAIDEIDCIEEAAAQAGADASRPFSWTSDNGRVDAALAPVDNIPCRSTRRARHIRADRPLTNNTDHSSRLAESGRLVRRMNHRVDPAAIAEEARTVRLDAVLGPPRRSVPVGDSSTPESRTLLFSIRAVVVKRFQANNSNFCRSRARASLRDQPLALPAWDQQEETEQSDSRTDRGRAIDTRVQSELVSSIVPRGTSLRWIVAPTVWRSSLRLSAPFPLSSGTRFHPSTCDA